MRSSDISQPSACLRLYIVRHGQTDYNLNNMFQGTSDIPLNETGIVQANQIAAMLDSIPFAAAYHSPLLRAKVTCERIINEKLKLVPDERLREVYFGRWEGVTRDEIKRRWPEQFRNYYSNVGAFEPPGGEKLPEAHDRVGEFYNELLKRHTEGHILIVGHQFINALLCTCIMGEEIAQAWDYRVQPGEVLLFENDGETITYRRVDL